MTDEQKYYYVVTRGGKLLLLNGQLPIYWNKKNAEQATNGFIGTELIRIKGNKLSELIDQGKILN